MFRALLIHVFLPVAIMILLLTMIIALAIQSSRSNSTAVTVAEPSTQKVGGFVPTAGFRLKSVVYSYPEAGSVVTLTYHGQLRGDEVEFSAVYLRDPAFLTEISVKNVAPERRQQALDDITKIAKQYGIEAKSAVKVEN